MALQPDLSFNRYNRPQGGDILAAVEHKLSWQRYWKDSGIIDRVVALILVLVLVSWGLLSFVSRPVPAILIGGSAVAGWHDATHRGYVVRAVHTYGRSIGVDFAIANPAIPGARVINPTVAANFNRWMVNSRGGLVVIAWGLNDVRLHTHLSVVLATIRREIRVARDTGHIVWIVSPPATTPSTTFDRLAAKHLWNHIAALGRSFHSRGVRVFNVMGPMAAVVQKRHQSISHYMDGVWDSNTDGHKLAARIMVKELETRVGNWG